jgi:hypothetical protein
MKISRGFVVMSAALIIVGLFLLHRWNEMADEPVLQVKPQDSGNYWLRQQERAARAAARAATNTSAPQPPPPSSNRPPHDLGFRQKANELSEAEKLEMTNLFTTKLKPAAEKWASVYGDHVPFSLADLNMGKFVERLGRDSKTYHSYTFVLGDITLGIAQVNGDTYVQYLASKRGLSIMQKMPTSGVAPDVSMPVTPSQVLALAQADCGHQIPANLVRLIPSAESGSLGGGVLADVGSAIRNAADIPLSKGTGFNYVFAKDGTLAYYMRN